MAKSKRIQSRFVHHVPTIACFNQAETPLGVDFDKLIAALQKYVDHHVAPVWGTGAKLVKSRSFLKGKWAMAFLEDYKESETEGFHDVTPEGLPMAKIFVRNILDLKDRVSMAASHELVEMLVDPGANTFASGPKRNRLYDYEAADPVEEMWFEIDGIRMCNFVYPTYFENFHKPGSVKFDHLGRLRRPFELHAGGYQCYWQNGKEKTVWGSPAKKKRFQKEDRRGHRIEARHSKKTKRSTAS